MLKGLTPITGAAASPHDGRAPAVEISGVGLRVLDREQPPVLQSDDPAGKIVPFARWRRHGGAESAAPEIILAGSDRALPALTGKARLRWTAALLCSMAAHAALYLPFQREPPPMASIGLETLAVDIVLGANEDAGLARERGVAEQSALTSVQTPEPAVDPRPKPEIPQAEPQKLEPQTVEPQRFETAAVDVRPSQDTPKLEAQAPVGEEPSTEAVVAAPVPSQAVPETPRESARPQPREPKTQAAPPPRHPAKPESRSETRRASVTGPPNESRSRAPAAAASGGVGRGRSDADTNYRGLVSAHLARHKRFPPEARSRGDQGSAVVTFALSGSGGVTSVRLTRPSGFASLDGEATAMVRRASPFPPPPDGRPVSFTVPVSFRLN
jgi:periplasmic protein TonB